MFAPMVCRDVLSIILITTMVTVGGRRNRSGLSPRRKSQRDDFEMAERIQREIQNCETLSPANVFPKPTQTKWQSTQAFGLVNCPLSPLLTIPIPLTHYVVFTSTMLLSGYRS